MLSRLDKLIKEDYSIDKFSNLSTPYQLAIVWFMAVDGNILIGSVILKSVFVIESIMSDVVIAGQ
jgi:hypothetical protein